MALPAYQKAYHLVVERQVIWAAHDPAGLYLPGRAPQFTRSGREQARYQPSRRRAL